MNRLFHIVLTVLFVLTVAFNPAVGQNAFKVIGAVPHLPVIDPTTVTTPQVGMLIFSSTDLKPMLYTGTAWETLCTENVSAVTSQEYFVVKNGIPILPAFGTVPVGALASGTIYYSTTDKSLMVHTGSNWTKMADMLTGTIADDNGFTAGVGVKTFKLPVLNSTPSPTGLTVGAFYINSSSKAVRYYDGSTWQDITCQAIVKTLPLTDLAGYTAMSGGEVITNGGSPITFTGICWSPNADPDTLLTSRTRQLATGSGIGVFASQLSGLLPNTNYHVRAYAVNALGVVYGEDRSFTSPKVPPTIITLDVSNITNTTTQSGGDVTADGGSPVTHRGIIWSSVSDPLNDPSNIRTDDGSGVGFFPSTLDGLLGNMTYYIRAYAVNAIGTSYGNLIQVTTPAPVPPVLISVINISDVTGSSAVARSVIMNNGGALVTERGVCYSTDGVNYSYIPSLTVTPTDVGTLLTSLDGLSQGVTYYVKGYAKNTAGIGYSSETSFITAALTNLITQKTVIVDNSTATGGGVISNAGFSIITERGICWGTTANPTVNLLTKVSESVTGDGIGAYPATLTGLVPGVTYYIRAYAINSSGTAYGNQDTLAMPVLATVKTIAASSLYMGTATCGGNVINDGGSAVTKRGVCWSSTDNTPTIYNSHTEDGTGLGLFTSVLAGLTPNVLYHFRAYAENTIGVSYGDTLTFTIIPDAPAVVTLPVTNILSMSATCAGNVQNNGGISVTARGILLSALGDPLADTHALRLMVGAGVGNFSTIRDSLLGNTQYYVRAFAVNSSAEAYGDLIVFTTLPAIQANILSPIFSMASITNTSAVGAFRIKNNGGAPITGRGIRYSTDRVNYTYVSSETLNNADIGVFSTILAGLTPNAVYYAQAFAINNAGTAFSDEVSFRTTSLPVLTTIAPNAVTGISASSGGNISFTGDDAISAKGICWSISRNPTYNLSTKTMEAVSGNDAGIFVSSITGLTPGVKYYVRAYAVNSFGVAYGNVDSLFTIENSLPLLTTKKPYMVTGYTAYSGGNVTSIGSDVITAKGVCWSTSTNPTSNLVTRTSEALDGTDTGNFSSYITGLTPSVKYYIRAYAVNSSGVAYGNLDSLYTATTAIVTTATPSSITNVTAVCGGSISNDGGATVYARGVCWGVFPNPTTADNYAANGSGTGSFSATLTGLMGSTKYYVRAYAKNSVGTSYGNLDSLVTTAPVLPVTYINDVINIGGTTALGRGGVSNAGGAVVTERGFCWNTTGTPTVDDAFVICGSGTGSFSSNLTGLTPNTKYYIRSYATNNVGTSYGNEITFSTFTIATVITTPASAITSTDATSGGNILNDGGALVFSSGICWNTTGNPTVNDASTNSGLGIGNFIHNLSGLMGSTTYYIRAYAINNAGTAYGNVQTFTTLPPVIPTLSTTSGVSGANGTTAYCGGSIISHGGALINMEGIVWSQVSGFRPDTVVVNRSAKSGSGGFTSMLNPLQPGITYYARAYATNSAGTGYANNEVSFTTFNLPVITTVVPTSITNVTANTGGNVTSNGGTDVIESGLCWSTNSLPTLADNHLSDGSGLGLFTRTITELLGGTTYYVRAYARNSVGSVYGQVESFLTQPAVLASIITTQPVVNSGTTAISGGNITSHGGSLVTSRGICWSTQAGFNPDTITVTKTAQTGYYKGIFNATLTGLLPNTVYYVRAYVVNGVGTAYGEEMNIKTPALPILTTTYTTSNGPTKAVGGGIISDDGGADIGARGVVWNTVPTFIPDTVTINRTVDGGGAGSFVSKLKGLKGNTTYYIQAYASNIAGTSYGNLLSFITDPATLASLVTLDATDIKGATVVTGGSVSDNGGEPITSRGMVWSTSHNFRPDTVVVNKMVQGAMGIGNFSATILGLKRGITYYARAYAANSIGIAYGNEISFKTLDLPTLTTMPTYPSSTGYAASGGGTLVSDGGDPITNQGVCWSLNPNPTTGLFTKTTYDSWSGTNFISNLTNLAPVTKYYVRAYASNTQGTSYGNEVTFTTPPALATITTTYATPISISSVATGGNITFNGGAPVTARGIIWSNIAGFNPDTVVVNKTHDGIGSGKFNSTTANMQLSIMYYIRAYAVTSAGISYGNQITVTLFPTAPILNTNELSQITGVSAMTGGVITSDGGAPVTLKGICWSTHNNPTTSDSYTTNSDGTDPYTAMVSGLVPNTLYYVRAYAINKIGTAYGVEKTFQTNAIPTLTGTSPVTDIIATTATSGGRITDDGRSPILSRGVCWSTSSNPTVDLSTKTVDTSSGSIGSFIATIKGLAPTTIYYVRAYATNAVGTGYGSQVQFSTLAVMLPALTTTQPYNVDSVKATSGGNVTDNGGMPVTLRGICWGTSPNPTTALASKINNVTGGDGVYTNTFTGLLPGTKYYVRAYAVNTKGTAYGNLDSLTTQIIRPTISNLVISSITNTTGVGSASVITDGGATVTRGLCWNSTGTPTIADVTLQIGTGVGNFSDTIKNLTQGVTYYVRAFATNSVGTVYSPTVSLKTITTPTITTANILGINATNVSGTIVASAISGGNISDSGGSTIVSRGVCWSTSPAPTELLTTKTSNGTGIGIFSSSLTGLALNTKYYVRAYARNSIGTSYGNEISFTTPTLPTVTTSSTIISASNPTIATGGGTVTNDGGISVTARGVCWSIVSGPVITDSHTNEAIGTGTFASTLSGLLANTTYYVRAYATNVVGVAYGNEVTVITPAIPTLTTAAVVVDSNNATIATSGGSVSDDGGTAVLARGVCWGTTTGPIATGLHTTDGIGLGNFTSNITGLNAGTKYYLRAYARNSVGTAYGNEIIFSTPSLALVNTSAATFSLIDPSTAVGGGFITSDGGAPVTARGLYWSTSSATPVATTPHSSDGTGTGMFSSNITGLSAGTTYYVTAYAVNAIGTAYGQQVIIKAPTVPTVLTTATASSATDNTQAIGGGTITTDGGTPVTARGVCWSSATSAPTLTSPHTTDGTGFGAFSSTLTGLLNGTTYYVRAYATNAVGTTYGAYTSFTTNTIPTVTTAIPTVSSDEPGVGKSGGNVTADGGAAITTRGVCWSLTNTTPALTDSHSTDGSGTGVFSSILSGLDMTKKYYVRAYATNAAGTAYGAVVQQPTTPTVSTSLITASTTDNSVAYSGGTVTDEGGASVTSRGICWSSITGAPTIAGPHTSDGTRSGSFTSTMTGLLNGTTYYVRAYATNAVGTTYGVYTSFITKTIPTVTTAIPTVSSDEPGVGKSGGNVTADGGAAITARGVCWSLTNTTPALTDSHSTDGSGTGSFTSILSGLDMTKKYYVRAYATNAAGTAYGAVVQQPTTPTVSTSLITASTTDNSLAYSGGAVTDEGGASVLVRGICWSSVTSAPVIGGSHTSDGTRSGSFTSTMTGLLNGTTYYVRAYATNAVGTTYGVYTSFTTKTIPTVTTAIPTVSSDEPGVGKSGGNVTADGGAAITSRGVCWSLTNTTPALTDSHSTDGSGTGTFTSILSGLDMTKKYYVRAYATNAAGTAYGAVVQQPTTPTVSTSLITASTTDNSLAYSGGAVTDEGGASVLVRGICWSSVTTAPVIGGSHTSDGTRSGSFTSTMTGLLNGTTYYVRAYATNAVGTTYGVYTSFTTKTIPTVTTAIPTVSSDEPGVGKSGGNVTADGGAAITSRGVCWSLTNTTPALTDSHSTDGSGTGTFTSILSGLDMTKKYYVRAYATNAAGTAYGAVVQQPTTPTVSTSLITASTTDNSLAYSGGTVTDEGGASVLVRGICWSSVTSAPVIGGSHTSDGTRSGSFTSTMTGLSNGTTYYVRAYATNAVGTTYGVYTSFTTKTIPTVTTAIPTVSSDEPGVGKSGGNVTADGGAAITARGVCWSLTNITPTLSDSHSTDGSGTGTFTSILSSLDMTKKYYVRAYATNAAGTAYGAVVQQPTTPTVSTSLITASTTDNSLAYSGGTVTDEGGASVLVRGICWSSVTSAPVIGGSHTSDGTRSGSFTSTMTGLLNGTTYYVRAYATNAVGTTYGVYTSFTTKTIPTVTTAIPTVSSDEPGVGKSGGNVTADGGAAITSRGVCWSLTNTTPALTDSHSTDGSGTGAFTSILSSLDMTKKYYVRAYATNAAGTAYGAVVQQPTTPTIISMGVTVSSSGSTVAVSGGRVTDEGGASVLARGVCWGTGGSPLATGLHTTDGTRSGTFSSALTGLTSGTTYYFRAYATNIVGTTYGAQSSFVAGTIVSTMVTVAPTVTTAIPTISTDEPGIGSSGGIVTDDGGATITSRGVCWSSTNPLPTLADAHSSDGTGSGNFSSILTGLDVSKKYYVRAYAINSVGTSYGNVVIPITPTVTTGSVSLSTTDNTVAVSGGTVADEGGASVTNRGICWSSVTGSPLITDSHTSNGTRSGVFSSTLTGLASGTTYYIRAYATNAMGTTYGPYISFVTKVAPTVTTAIPTISTDEPGVGSSGGIVTDDGGAAITSRGVCWSSTNPMPTLADAHSSDGTGSGNFSSTLSGLDVSKKYYVRAYAINSVGTSYGNVVIPITPTVTTGSVSLSTTDNTVAVSGGMVTDEGGASVTNRGICWSSVTGSPLITDSHTSNGTRSGMFSSTLTGLASGTTYYIRAYATNAMGTTYGPYISFVTKVAPTVTTNLPTISTAEPGVGSSGGVVTDDGGAAITSRGVCWSSTNAMPTLADAHSSDGIGSGNFSSTLTGLDVSKKYYVRAYATNSAGLSYGNVVIPTISTVTTGSVSLSTTDNTVAISGGTVTDEGGASVTVRGICWSSVTGSPLITDFHTSNGTRSGTFSSTLTGLSNGTTYYIRAYAVNAMGTSYGPYISFVTKVTPTVTTNLPTISTDEPGVGSSGGVVTDDGGAAITSRGVCWSSTNAMPTLVDTHSSDGTGSGNFSSTLTGLDVSKKYYVRAYATNSAGLSYGNVVIPTTPTVTTGSVSLSTTDNTVAISGGTVTDEGGASVTNRGICWSSVTGSPLITDSHTSNGTRSGTFSSTLTGLSSGTTYYIRAYATSAMGTAYGPYISFVTKVVPTVTTNIPTISTAEPGVGSSGGAVTDDGGAAITSRGVCWSSTNPLPTITTDAYSSDGTGSGNFSSTLTGLDVSKKYYVRAYATNSAGLSYGNVVIPTTATVTTGSVSLSTTDNTVAVSGGMVTDEGGASVMVRGICWSSVTVSPLITDSHTSNGTRSGTFSSTLTGLTSGTTYYVRAYAINAMGISYGPYISFVTKLVPTVTTNLPTISTDEPGIGSSGGVVTDDGGAAITSRGVCWSSINAMPTLADAHSSDGTGSGNFSSILTGLDVSKKYYVRAYATNSAGSSYGNVVIPTTPTVVTGSAAVSSTDNSVGIGGGTVSNEGGAAVLARGVCWSSVTVLPVITDPHTTDSLRSGIFSSKLTGLANGTTYYVRAYAINAVGIVYGAYVSFTTKIIPTLTTTVPVYSVVDPTTANGGGNISTDGGAIITARGVCWSDVSTPDITDPHTTNGNGSGVFTSVLTGLDASKGYYVRAYATNSMGTFYGNQIYFTTKSIPTVTTVLPSISSTQPGVANCGGNVTNDGGATVTARGVCWSTVNAMPDITNSHSSDGVGTGVFVSTLTGLDTSTKYYVRSYAINSAGIAYGSVQIPTTPTVTTSAGPVVSTTDNTVGFSGGTVTNESGAAVLVRGVCWSSVTSAPVITDLHTSDGTGFGAFTSTLTGLLPGTTYYVRAYATNAVGTVYGAYVSFVTKTVPTVTTVIPTISAAEPGIGSSGGNVSSDGGATVTARGVCWSSSNPMPDLTNSYSSNGVGTGAFVSTLSGLNVSGQYYVRAYAINSVGIAYGAVQTATTPTVTTSAGPVVSTTDNTIASSGGTVTNEGGASVLVRGVCWSTVTGTPVITSDPHTVDGTRTGTFTSTLTGLLPGTTYYVRAYATNVMGTVYGAYVSFVTKTVPTLTTAVPTISAAEPGIGSSGGNVSSDGGATVTARGVCWSSSNAMPDITNSHSSNGVGTGAFVTTLTGLDVSGQYYVRAYAINSVGIAYGPVQTASTPTVTTSAGPVVSTTDNTVAFSGGTVTNEGGASVLVRGVCWSTVTGTPVITSDPHTVDGTRTGIFTSTLTGLLPGTTYYVRAYATNVMGTVYGAYVSFVTKTVPTLTTAVPTISTAEPGVGSSGGNVSSDGGATVTARGVCWSSSNAMPDITNSHSSDGVGTGAFVTTLTGLDVSRQYYVRAYAINSVGIAYGPVQTATTPTVTTSAGPVVSTTDNTVGFSGGTVTNEGGASVLTRGVCWSTVTGSPVITSDPHTVDGTRSGIFTSTLTGLLPGTTYYIRAYATNVMGTVYGAYVSFVTKTVPTLTTAVPTISAAEPGVGSSGGNVSSDGGAAVTARGVCWSSSNAMPDITNSHSSNGVGTGAFTSTLTGLDVSGQYYVRAYAINSVGIAYGPAQTASTPTVTTSAGPVVSTTDNTIASSGGTVTNEGGASVLARGVCWSTVTGSPVITSDPHTVDGTRSGTFTSTLTGLLPGTTYYVRAYATNVMGTVYGAYVSFVTKTVPTLTTAVPTISTAEPGVGSSGGNVSSDGGATVTARGVCWSSSNAMPDITDSHSSNGVGTGAFVSTLTGLDVSIKYYVRAYATNAAGTAYGSVQIPTTPTVTTSAVSSITSNSGVGGGNVTNEGGASVLARGVCWSTVTAAPVITSDPHTVDGTRSGIFTSTLTGLLPGTTYYVRAYVTNVMGTVYGAYVSFRTL